MFFMYETNFFEHQHEWVLGE